MERKVEVYGVGVGVGVYGVGVGVVVVVVVLLLRCSRCVAGSPNPPQPKGPKREPTQQTHGGRTGHPRGGPPPEKAIAFFGLLDPRSPLHKGEINMMVGVEPTAGISRSLSRLTFL